MNMLATIMTTNDAIFMICKVLVAVFAVATVGAFIIKRRR